MLREENVGQPGKTVHRMMLCDRSILADCESEPSEDIGGGYTGVWPNRTPTVSILLVIMILQVYCKSFCGNLRFPMCAHSIVFPLLTLCLPNLSQVLPQNCWAPDGSAMFLSTLDGPNHSVFKVDKSGEALNFLIGLNEEYIDKPA